MGRARPDLFVWLLPRPPRRLYHNLFSLSLSPFPRSYCRLSQWISLQRKFPAESLREFLVHSPMELPQDFWACWLGIWIAYNPCHRIVMSHLILLGVIDRTHESRLYIQASHLSYMLAPCSPIFLLSPYTFGIYIWACAGNPLSKGWFWNLYVPLRSKLRSACVPPTNQMNFSIVDTFLYVPCNPSAKITKCYNIIRSFTFWLRSELQVMFGKLGASPGACILWWLTYVQHPQSI